MPIQAPLEQPLALERLAVTGSDGGWVLAAAESHTQVLAAAGGANGPAWRLVTPPAVSTRGGLVGAFASQADALVGVIAHGTLLFSPLALTRDGGRAWLPEVLPGPLVRSPEALSLSRFGLARALLTSIVPAGTTTSRGGDGSVMASSNWGASWSTLASYHALAGIAQGAGCALAGLTGVTVSDSGATTVLGSCRSPGRAVLLTQARPGSPWRAGALVPPAGNGSATVQPLWVAGLDPAGQAGQPAGAGGAKGSGRRGSGTGGSGTGGSGTRGSKVVGGGRAPGGPTVALLVSDQQGDAVVVGTRPAGTAASLAWTWSARLPLGPLMTAPAVGLSPGGLWWVLPPAGGSARRLEVLRPEGTWSAWRLPSGSVQAAGLAAGGFALSVVVHRRRFTILGRVLSRHRSWTPLAQVRLVS